jgi:hypothetical protein
MKTVPKQAPANGGEGQALVPDPGEDLADDPGCILVDLVTGSASPASRVMKR